MNSPEPGNLPVFTTLKELSVDNANFFKKDASSSGKRMYTSFCRISESIDVAVPCISDLMQSCDEYDFDSETRGNGHRSFITAMELIARRATTSARNIFLNRNSYFFRKSYYSREIESCSHVIDSLIIMVKHCKTLMTWCSEGRLFPREDHLAHELLGTQTKFVNQYAFYGRCIGFQFCESIALIFKALSILMASFSEFYYGGGKMIDFLVNGSKYLIDPEIRSKRLVNISQYSSVDFCKTFWFLGEMELMQRLPSISFSSLAVNKLMLIELKEMTISTGQNSSFQVPIPCSHKSNDPIPVRLLSSMYYYGMEDIPKKEGVKDASPGLVFHCHGGGFVAQSSRSHETYLRQWALNIPAPIVSVDYSLAPECPFPRALEEVFYAYCWTLKNAAVLGTTAERIVLAGDSAGANLNLGLAMKCIETGVRPPDGIFLAYAPVVLNFVPSPSRLLCLMDPLLPFGFLMGCTKAYACSRDVYHSSKAHEHKLARNIGGKYVSCDNAPSGSRCDSSQSDFASPDDNSDDANDVYGGSSYPVLMEKNKSYQTIYNYIQSIMNALTSRILPKNNQNDNVVDEDSTRIEDEIKREAFLPCPMDMMDFDVPKDPYLSPFFASDSVLKAFPPVAVLTVHFDPFLDDCVEFAKKLKHLGNPVTLDILDGLSHGFLNFSMICKEASEGSKVCISRIKTLLNMNANEA